MSHIFEKDDEIPILCKTFNEMSLAISFFDSRNCLALKKHATMIRAFQSCGELDNFYVVGFAIKHTLDGMKFYYDYYISGSTISTNRHNAYYTLKDQYSIDESLYTAITLGLDPYERIVCNKM